MSSFMRLVTLCVECARSALVVFYLFLSSPGDSGHSPVGSFLNRLEWKYLFCLPISPKDLLSMKFSQSPKVFASLDWSASEREAVLRFFLGSERVLRFSSCSKVSKKFLGSKRVLRLLGSSAVAELFRSFWTASGDEVKCKKRPIIYGS